jgi:hypothetical protein
MARQTALQRLGRVCASDHVTYTPKASQSPGASDTVNLDVETLAGCLSALSIGSSAAVISIQSNSSFSVWRLKNITIAAGGDIQTTGSSAATAYVNDRANFQAAIAGTVDARLEFQPGALFDDFVPPGAAPTASSDNGPFFITAGGSTEQVDDPSYAPAFAFTGTPPDNGTVSGTFPNGADVCLEGGTNGASLFEPFEAIQPQFQMSVTSWCRVRSSTPGA